LSIARGSSFSKDVQVDSKDEIDAVAYIAAICRPPSKLSAKKFLMSHNIPRLIALLVATGR